MNNYNDKDKAFLKGSDFSSAYTLGMQNVSELRTRLDYIRELFSNKRVLHFGCVDHLPLIEKKRGKGQWFHEEIYKVAELCYGVDINKEGIDFLNKEGFASFVLDVENDPIPDQIKKENWDYIFLGEILEHIDNPVYFLNMVRTKFEGNANQVIISVPNALTLSNFLNAFRKKEIINSDHRFWFTPYTLGKVVTESGFVASSFDTCQGEIAHATWYKSMILKRFPLLRDKIILKAHF